MNLDIDILNKYPAADEVLIDAMLSSELAKNRQKIVVLDDDPTGVQTVHDISVYTGWDAQSLDAAFAEEGNLFYILTNSRGMTAEETTKIHREIADRTDAAARKSGKKYMFISRSDSTLRGHYPLETSVLRQRYEANTGRRADGEILCPFFKEGGRFTIGDIHYVSSGSELIPACESEYARDKTFGYSALTMPEYIEEKTAGLYRAEDTVCISLDNLRTMRIDYITQQLMQICDFHKVIVNAIDYSDVKVFCIALLRAMSFGKTFMFRTAAGFVKVIGGVCDQDLLSREQMITDANNNGGVIIAGSHTEKTSRQIEQLKTLRNMHFIEFNASLVNDDELFRQETERCLKEEEAYLAAGKTVCCYTSRSLVTADTGNKEDELRLAIKISDAVKSLIGNLTVVPSFIIAKGGITSSDIGTKALNVKRVDVLGQICPGIPVWKTGRESRFPGIPYVIFPGNVGDDDTLKTAAEVLIGKKEQ